MGSIGVSLCMENPGGDQNASPRLSKISLASATASLADQKCGPT